MTPHFFAFIVDFFSWLIAGGVLGLALYPDKRVKHLSKKLLFISIAIVGSLLGGLYATINNGLPDVGFAYSNFIFALFVGFFSLFILNPAVRMKLKSQLQQLDSSMVLQLPKL